MTIAWCRWLLVVALSGIVAPAASGRDDPLQDRTDIPISWNASSPPDMERIQRAIIAGCARRGWQCGAIKPGEIRAVLIVRRHMAKSLISFDTKNFSIEYVDSTELRYDALKKTIHRKYNLWVSNLIGDINAAIAAIQ